MKSLLGGFIFFCFVAVLAFSQGGTSTLTGTVKDPQEAVVQGATITVVNIDTNEMRTAKSGASGEYTVPNLLAGKYIVTVEKTGFEKVIQNDVVLQVDQSMKLDFALKVAAAAGEVVVVNANSVPNIETQHAGTGGVITNEEIVDLPLNGRDFSDLAYLVPGVGHAAQGANGSQFSISGSRSDMTGFLIDGMSVQNPAGGGAMARPNIDAMQEFKMQTTGYPAEYGPAGGIMNMQLRSGGNILHGSVFEYFRNDKLDSRSFFDVGSKAELRQNQFGGLLSGPVVIPKVYDGHDKTFFLASWESYRQVSGSDNIDTVPTMAQRAGDFSSLLTGAKPVQLLNPFAKGTCGANAHFACLPGNVIPASELNPVSLAVLPYYPLPNYAGGAGGNNYFSDEANPNNWDSILLKVDHRLTQNDTVSFRWLDRWTNNPNPYGGSAIPGWGFTQTSTATVYGLNWVRILNPTLIDEFRFAYNRVDSISNDDDTGTNPDAILGITAGQFTTDPGLTGFPRFTVRNMAAIGDSAGQPSKSTLNTFEYADTLTWVKDKHLFKFGGDVTRTQLFEPYLSDVRGTYNFLGRWTSTTSSAPFADFMLGLPNSVARQIGDTTNYLFTTDYSFFAQDDYRVLSNLTLNVGLRYEILKPPIEKYGRTAAFIPEYDSLVLSSAATVPNLQQLASTYNIPIGTASQFGMPQSLVYTSYTDFAPRFGFAWQPLSDMRTVVRGGYGIFFSPAIQNPIINGLGDVFPFMLSETVNFNGTAATAVPPTTRMTAPFPLTPGGSTGTNNASGFINLHPPSQYVQSWNLTVERELPGGMIIEVGYVASKGTHLDQKYNYNAPLLTGSAVLPKPVSNFGTVSIFEYGANSTYESGQIRIRKRFSRGLFYSVNYVYGKAIDDSSQANGGAGAGGGGTELDAYNLALNRGRSDFDAGHTFSMMAQYEVPYQGSHWYWKRWMVGVTGQMHTGMPFTPGVSNVDLATGESARPNRIGKGSLQDPTYRDWFNLSDFPTASTNAYGNSGRNILDGPGLIVFNISLIKTFTIKERQLVQFRMETFNTFNMTNFLFPNVNVDAPNGGVITGAQAGREIQFGLRYTF